jgi:hypothetical protein
MKLNKDGYQKAKDLIEKNQYVLDSDWSEAQPDNDRENEFLDDHGWDSYSEWFLAIDDDASPETKGHFNFPYGDFRRVHRDGLIAAKQRAAQNNYSDVEEAADDLLEMIDTE